MPVLLGQPIGRIAIFSDVHGHLAGLQAVLEDADVCGCERLICLGDVVDGGADNDAVSRYLRDRSILTLRGNHDEPDTTEGLALSPDVRAYLAGLPEGFSTGDVLFTHITPRKKKSKITDQYEAWNVFDETKARRVFVGHIHAPLIFGENSDEPCSATSYPIVYNLPFLLASADRYIVCVGAVGYPRDGLRKPRYCIYDLDEDMIEFRAVDGPVLPLG